MQGASWLHIEFYGLQVQPWAEPEPDALRARRREREGAKRWVGGDGDSAGHPHREPGDT